jgi:undecaprenyl-diphosphatase
LRPNSTAERLFGLDPPGVFVEVALHAATLASVLVVYGHRLVRVVRGVVGRQPADVRYAALLLLASVPAGIVGLTMRGLVERAFDSALLVGIALIVTGLVLWLTRGLGARRPEPDAAGAVVIGVAQAIAILPGVSRSGATVAAGLWRGLAPAQAAEFSFLMVVPAVAGALLLQVGDAAAGAAAVGVLPLGLAGLAARGSGVWALRFLVALLERGRFHAFAPYCWAVGAITVGVALWRG